MAELTPDDVAHLADLARITVPPDQLPHYAEQLAAILDAVSTVGEVAAAEVPPMSHPQAVVNVERADEVRPGLTQEQALAMAPAQEDGRFRVPRILEDQP